MKISFVKRARLLMVGVAGIGLMSCQTLSAGGDLGLPSTVQQACLAGAVAGGLAGALEDSNNRGRDALIGAGIGLLVGCTAGSILNNRRAQYATDAQYYDAQIIAMRENNARLEVINAETAQTVAALDAEIARLRSLSTLTAADRELARANLASAQSTLNLTNQRIKVLERELQAQTDGLAIQDTRGEVPPQTLATLQQEVQALRVYVEGLKGHASDLSRQQDSVGQFL